ncbi:hypothetical protein FOA52_004175 [Chlamydomonas sp. UWO 241]|nr:hypothetical protein FOA52_004175 [Chlamydomonas sp. UWO 241]
MFTADICNAWKHGNELEAAISRPQTSSAQPLVNAVAFNNVLSHAMHASGGRVVRHEEVLDISLSNGVRVSIRGRENISIYCSSGVLPSSDKLRFMRKTRLQSLELPDLCTRLRLSSEDAVRASDLMNRGERTLRDSPTNFRLKKRVSVEGGADDRVRYDFTIVKQVEGSRPNFGNVREQREIEMEYVGTETQPPRPEALSELWAKLLRVFFADPLLTPMSVKEDVVAGYLGLVCAGSLKPDALKNLAISAVNAVRGVRAVQGASGYRKYFAGPQPVTLDRSAMRRIATGTLPYAVTPKADGQRALLYVHLDGTVNYINNRLDAKRTDVRLPATGKATVLDVEVVIEAGSVAMYAFDAYFVNGAKTHDQELPARLKHVERAVAQIVASSRSTRFSFKSKEFATGDGFHANVAKVAAGKYPFETDGYIITPIRATAQMTFRASGVSSGLRVYKWKPMSQNTVDFLVSVVKDARGSAIVHVRDGVRHKTLRLMVGSALSTPEDYYRHRGTSTRYIAKEFSAGPSSVEVRADAPKCDDGDLIQDGFVVEFAFSDGAWRALRVRHDKTSDAIASGSVTANNVVSANNVFRSIREDITMAELGGAEPPVAADPTEPGDVYYDRDVERDETSLTGMASFHNRIVKGAHTLTRLASSRNARSVVDVAVGKAGDLNKWVSAGYATVLGLDLSEDNIYNPADGAYRRLADSSGVAPDWRYAFLPMDTSEDLVSQIASIKDDFARAMARCIWPAEGRHNRDDFDASIRHLYDLPEFDVASCQFAMHYYFESRAKADGVLGNAAKLLKKGGYFVGTCFDGDAVAARLATSNRLASSDGGKTWSIEKRYVDAYDPTAFGQRISVYLKTINVTHDEFLVPCRR